MEEATARTRGVSTWRRLVPLLLVAALVLAACVTDQLDTDKVDLYLEVTPKSGVAPLTVEFTALDRNEVIDDSTKFRWRFGDGAFSTAQNPDHMYTAPGEYRVRLRITLGDGSKLTRRPLIEVLPPTPSFESWVVGMNAACAESVAQAATVTGDPTTRKALNRFAAITRAESRAISAAGVPEERSEAVEEWLELRDRGSELFLELADKGSIDESDPRVAELQSIGEELAGLSGNLGLEDCVGGL